MAKLRHVAMAVNDLEEAAQFYEKAFEMERVGQTDSELAGGIYLSDGTMCLALLNYKSDKWAGKVGKDYVGIHHIGFWVDDLPEAEEKVLESGGEFFADLPVDKNSLYYEKKFLDPNGIVLDLTPNGWAGATK